MDLSGGFADGCRTDAKCQAEIAFSSWRSSAWPGSTKAKSFVALLALARVQRKAMLQQQSSQSVLQGHAQRRSPLPRWRQMICPAEVSPAPHEREEGSCNSETGGICLGRHHRSVSNHPSEDTGHKLCVVLLRICRVTVCSLKSLQERVTRWSSRPGRASRGFVRGGVLRQRCLYFCRCGADLPSAGVIVGDERRCVP